MEKEYAVVKKTTKFGTCIQVISKNEYSPKDCYILFETDTYKQACVWCDNYTYSIRKNIVDI